MANSIPKTNGIPKLEKNMKINTQKNVEIEITIVQKDKTWKTKWKMKNVLQKNTKQTTLNY